MRAYAYLLLTPLWALGPHLDIVATCPDPSQPCAGETRDGIARAVANDNMRSAGRRHGDTLVVSLVAQPARWYPESDTGQSLQVLAFAEEGRAPSVPGPLVRVPAGTIVRVRVRNGTARALWMRGLHDHPVPPGTAALPLAPDSTREVTFAVTTPGTYAYEAALAPFPAGGATVRRLRDDSQLVGAFVVDPASPRGRTSAEAPRDRIMVITRWAIVDSTSGPQNILPYYVTAMNGRSWPHTERLAYSEGDSVRWRVLNASAANHPMHLHGFYFNVDAKGTTTGDTVLERPRVVVTEILALGQTMRMTWRAERPGNWLFHCHLLVHMSTRQRLTRFAAGDTLLGAEASRPAPGAMGAHDHATMGMSGLIMGIARAALGDDGGTRASGDAAPLPPALR